MKKYEASKELLEKGKLKSNSVKIRNLYSEFFQDEIVSFKQLWKMKPKPERKTKLKSLQ